jgi:Tol biopolymer transport system component
MALDLESLLKVPFVEPYGKFDISPDGVKIAFSWNASGQWEIYEARLDLSTPPRQISLGPGGKFSPRYAPDGGRLAYVLDLDGGEVFDLFIYEFATGLHSNLTPDDPGSIQSNYCWSPDGSQIAFISDRSGHFDTYVIGAEGGLGRLFFGLEQPDVDVKWSPDGKWLAVTGEAERQNFATFILPATGGTARRIVDVHDPIDVRQVDWSPNSTRLAFSSSRSGWQNIGIYDLENDKIEWVTSGDGDKEAPRWSPDGRRLIFLRTRWQFSRMYI